jgi:uncharacterized protein YciI
MSDSVITAKQIVDLSHQYGFLAKQLYVCFTTPINGMEKVMETLPAHAQHLVALEKRGALMAAGPLWTDDGRWEGEGMFVLRAGSQEEAAKIAAEDPMHVTGARSFKIRPWLLNEGVINLQMTFSTGKAELN